MIAEPVSPAAVAAGWSRNAELFLGLIGRGHNSAARTLAGCVLIGALWTGLGIPLYYLLSSDGDPGTVRYFVVANLSILALLAGLALAVRWVQRRPLLTLVTPHGRLDGGRIAQGFVVSFAIISVAFAIECVLYPGRYAVGSDLSRLWVFVPAVLLLTPLQAATEELVFRGYLMQSLRTFTRRPLLIVALSSLLFVLPHLWNPEAQHGVLVALNYTAIAVFLAVVTLRDGRLELAIGAHTANNVFIALVANYPDSTLNTPSLFISDVFDPAYSLASVIAGSVAFYLWFFGRRAA